MKLPIGVHLTPSYAAIAQYDGDTRRPKIIYAEAVPYETIESDTFEGQQLGALVRLLADLPQPQSECVVSLPADAIAVRGFPVPKRSREKDLRASASIDADTEIPDVPPSRRIVAIAQTGDPTQRMLCLGDQETLENMLALVRTAGLDPVACDVPIAVWQRTLGGTTDSRQADAVLDLSAERATVFIFPDNHEHAVGRTISLPAGNVRTDTLVRTLRSALVEARRDDFANVRTIALFGGSPEQRADIIAQLSESDETLIVAPYALKGIESPPWAYAVGLATWGIAGHDTLRANLIQRDPPLGTRLREHVGSPEFMRAMGGFAAAVIMAGAYGFSLNGTQRSLQAQSASLQATILTKEPQRARIQAYLTADENLEAIDRDAAWLRRSGQVLGLQLAYIGNAIPANVWLDSLSSTPQGWALNGHALSLEAEVRLIARMGRANPGYDTRFGAITSEDNYAFRLTIQPPATPPPTPQPQPQTEASP